MSVRRSCGRNATFRFLSALGWLRERKAKPPDDSANSIV